MRFNLPVMVEPYSGDYDATAFGPACPQQVTHVPDVPKEVQDVLGPVLNAITNVLTPSDEDCERELSVKFRTLFMLE